MKDSGGPTGFDPDTECCAYYLTFRAFDGVLDHVLLGAGLPRGDVEHIVERVVLVVDQLVEIREPA